MTGCACSAGTVRGRCAYCGARRTPPRARARAELGAAETRGTRAERINNAIVALDWAAAMSPSTTSPGVRQAIGQLAAHWQRFFRDGSYWVLPDPVWASKLGRYVQWYARGYYLLAPAVRASLVAPAAIDPEFLELVNDTVKRMVDANTTAAAAAAELVKETASGVMDLGLLWLALGGLALWKIYASAPRSPQEDR
jgi:hypothetical protein